MRVPAVRSCPRCGFKVPWHGEAARQGMRAGWTPERRAQQAERMRAILYEVRVKGTKGRVKSPEERLRLSEAVKRAMTPEVRRRIGAGVARAKAARRAKEADS